MLQRILRRRSTDPAQNPELWQDQTTDAVVRALTAAQLASSEEDKRKWRMLHDFLRGHHSTWTQEAALDLYPERAREWMETNAIWRYYPLVSAYTDRLAVAMATRLPELKVYDLRTGKDHPTQHPEALQWSQDLEDAKADVRLPGLERMVVALGNSIISPTWIGDRIRWCLAPPYQVDIWQSLQDPSDLSMAHAISFEMAQPVDSVGMTQPSIYSTWTREPDGQGGIRWGHYVHDAAGAIMENTLFGDSNVNGYGRHPHVLVQVDEVAPGEIWVPPRESWIQQQLGLSVALTDLYSGLRYHAWAVAVTTGAMGVRDDDEPVIGPGSQLDLPTGATLDFKAPPLSIDEYKGLLEHDLKISGVAEAIDPSAWSVDGAYQSVIGMKLRHHGLQRRQERVRPYLSRALRDLFDVHRAVGNYWADRGASRTRYSDTTALRVVYRPLPEVHDRQADAMATEMEIDKGITSVVERIMDREGVGRDEAERRMRERLAQRPDNSSEG